MIVTVFRSRLRPDAADYPQWAARMGALARTMPGFISHKTYTAEDGERVTIVEFESEEAQRAWAANAEHREAQKLGRGTFYSEFRIQVCTVQRERSFPAK